MIKKKTVEQKWRERSETANDEAAKLPYGKLKDQLLREASHLLRSDEPWNILTPTS
jgi:hypothetical protein